MSTVNKTLENFSKVTKAIGVLRDNTRIASIAFDGQVLKSEATVATTTGYAVEAHGNDFLGRIAANQDILVADLMLLANDMQDFVARISGAPVPKSWGKPYADKVADEALRTALQTAPDYEKETV